VGQLERDSVTNFQNSLFTFPIPPEGDGRSVFRNLVVSLDLRRRIISRISVTNISLCNLGDWTEHFGIYPYRKPTNASNDHSIVMSSQMLLHVSAYQHQHQGAHTILTSYLYVSVHYKKNNGVSNNNLQSVLLHYGNEWLWLTAAGSTASSSS
jgi:hypothetical protein